jgi:acyl carrier protein
MEKEEIKNELNKIFVRAFKDEDLIVNTGMSANDVEGWDSISHMIMISMVEEQFHINIKLRELFTSVLLKLLNVL